MKFMERVAKALMPAPQNASNLRAKSASRHNALNFSYPSGEARPTTATWHTTPESPSRIIYEQLSAIRARSRQQYRASDYIRRYAHLVKSNLVGPYGIRYQSFAKGADGSLDIELSAAIEKEINRWLGMIDYYGDQPWPDLLNTIGINLPVDGEVFAKISRSGFLVKVQLIDPELVRVNDWRDLSNGNRVRFGLELDQNDRVVAYYVWPSYPYGSMGFFGPADVDPLSEPVRVPAQNMIHLYEKEYVGQLRGFPWTSTAISRTHHMEKWDEAALVNARYGAANMVFFKTPDGYGLYDQGEWPNGYKVTHVAPGRAEMLPEGVEPIAYDPTYPSNEYEPFTARNLRGASSGLNVAYESLANDRVGVNFSSIRAGVQEDREFWRNIQQVVIRNLCEPLVQRQYRVSSLDARSVFFGMSAQSERFDRLTAHKWFPRTWAPVDPVKDITASEKEIAMGVKSRTQHMMEMGRDPTETWDQIRKEREVMDALGLEPAIETQIDVDVDEGE